MDDDVNDDVKDEIYAAIGLMTLKNNSNRNNQTLSLPLRSNGSFDCLSDYPIDHSNIINLPNSSFQSYNEDNINHLKIENLDTSIKSHSFYSSTCSSSDTYQSNVFDLKNEFSHCYSDSLSDSGSNLSNEFLMDSEFNSYYSQENLYSLNKAEFFDNKRYRIFCKRYGNQIYCFKPISIVRETNRCICKVIGTYCLDSNKLDSIHPLPDDFIWPLNANKNEENIKTIRQLIKDNPIDQLPYTDTNKKDIREAELKNSNEIKDYPMKSNSNSKVNKSSSIKRKSKKVKRYQTAVSPHHCPYCFRLFSANFNAKLHYNGRYNANTGIHISCKVASKIRKEKNFVQLEPILCAENCKICLKQNSD